MRGSSSVCCPPRLWDRIVQDSLGRVFLAFLSIPARNQCTARAQAGNAGPEVSASFPTVARVVILMILTSIVVMILMNVLSVCYVYHHSYYCYDSYSYSDTYDSCYYYDHHHHQHDHYYYPHPNPTQVPSGDPSPLNVPKAVLAPIQ
jgi:hypothetical protein